MNTAFFIYGNIIFKEISILNSFEQIQENIISGSAFSKFYRRYSALVEKYNVGLKTLLQQGISEPEFYGDLVNRFIKKCGKI